MRSVNASVEFGDKEAHGKAGPERGQVYSQLIEAPALLRLRIEVRRQTDRVATPAERLGA